MQTVNQAAEIRGLAERQMGAFLKEMPKAGPQHSTGGGSIGSKREPLPDAPPTLASIGITKKQSAQAQKLAEIPEPEFRERIAVTSNSTISSWARKDFSGMKNPLLVDDRAEFLRTAPAAAVQNPREGIRFKPQ